ncbi:hypothetical protein AWJ20_1077 [Sugiyamaella lignohabitans]|uniref:Nup120p n=1 Tax=Sugiyamaella lignohabitans TaxID=796027 RepID=A0A167DDX4_9ASCO|nr:uncharacterized protein AWJ20_1077 [Sugiyamaella lignohabitans]ANB12805.1 hypothetical protein AWJ20_1077 [Sugiyamaella lignohabitans]
MTLTLSRESVVYKSGNDANQLLELKLPQPDADISSLDSTNSQNSEDHKSDVELNYYRDQLATTGSVFTRKHVGLPIGSKKFPQSILWRVFQKTSTLELSAIDLGTKGAALPVLRTIRLNFPLPIFERCIALSEDKDYLVIDILVKPGLLYTLQIPFDQFIVSGNNSNQLSDENSHLWRSIKFPYGFDIRKPYLLHAISSKVLIASTVDGALTKFVRDSPLGDISWYPFQDSGRGLSLSSLLPWNSSNTVPGNPSLSAKTIISIDSLPNRSSKIDTGSYIVTVSINRAFKVWSLDSMSVVAENILDAHLPNEPGPARSSLYLESAAVPRHVSFGHHYNDNSHGLRHSLLVTYTPFNEGLFKFWSLNHDGEVPSLVEMGPDFEIVPVAPRDKSSIWFVADFELISYSDKLLLVVAWKSDTSTVTISCTIPKNLGKDESNPPYWSLTESEHDKDDLEGLCLVSSQSTISEGHSEGFIRKIFGPTGYSKETIKTAIPVYADHYRGFPQNSSDRNVSLIGQVCRVVGAAVSVENSGGSFNPDFEAYERDIHLQWIRFDRLCAELEKQGHEFLSLVYDEHTDRVSLVKASSVSLIRPLTALELIYFNRSALPAKYETEVISTLLRKNEVALVEGILRTVDALVRFRKFLPKEVRSDLLFTLKEQFNRRESYLTADRIAYMYESILEGKVTENSLESLVTALYDIPALDNVIQSVLELFTNDTQQNEREDALTLTRLGASAHNTMLNSFFSTGRIITFDIIVLLLLSSSQPDLVSEYVANYPSYLSTFKSLSAVMDLQFSGASDSTDEVVKDSFVYAVQQLTVTDSSHVNGNSGNLSFLEGFIVRQNLANSSINLESIWKRINTNTQSKMADLVVDMFLQVKESLSANTNDLIEFINIYLPSDPFSTFVKGNILLAVGDASKGALLLHSASLGMSSENNQITDLQKSIAKKISEVYWLPGNLFNGLVCYNNAVAQVAAALGAHIQAMEFAQLAAEGLAFSSLGEDKLVNQIFTTLLRSALHLREYDEAYNALVELDLNSCPPVEMKKHLEEFIKCMANGDGLRLCRLPFVGMTHIVSSILEAKAAINSDDIPRISYHKLLYSWKMERGDYQGGKFILIVYESYLEEQGLTISSCISCLCTITTS